jgi:precorrin-6A/cobalt-precorrin-6A reductase
MAEFVAKPAPTNVNRIWLIGGTQESAQIAQAIAHTHILCLISVTTESARSLYPIAPNLQILVGKIASQTIKMFLQEHSVGAILDASHPYAVAVSQLAIAAAATHQIPYLRFERPALAVNFNSPNRAVFEDGQDENSKLKTQNSKLKTPTPLPNFETLLTSDILTDHRVLLTIGYRFLPLFQPWHDRAALFARILPSPIALETALAAGFTGDRLIALRPPISVALETALWHQWQISLVVTKASGIPGGEAVKRQVAAALGVELVIIERPAIGYPQQTSDLAVAVAFCQQTADW